MKNLSLNAKFVGVLSIFVAASLLISILGIFKLSKLNDSLDNIVTSVVPRVAISQKLLATAAEIKNQEKVFILESSKEGMDRIEGVLAGLEKSLTADMEKLKSMLVLEVSKKELEVSIEDVKRWSDVDAEIQRLSRMGKNVEATALARGKSRDLMNGVSDRLNAVVERNDKMMIVEEQNAIALYTESRNILLAVSLSSILIGLTLAFFILRALNKAIDNVISGLNDSANQVTSAAQQIAASSEELSQGATEQASSLEETSSAVEEMNSMVQKNAESARQSSEVSTASGTSATRGKKVVEEMKRAMQDIDAANSNIMHQTNESNEKISEIVKVISEIGNKTKVINDIVFQTKLLSFNASVEAARAGEHGKGFAVVAEEVGNLAQMSGNAAKEISTMLDSSIQKVESIVRETRSSVEKLITESKQKVELGTKVAVDCGEVLEEIVSNVSQVASMSHSISGASDEQARGIAEITKAVTQLDQMTQQNAAASEETASAAEELSAQAESMQAVVQTLIVTIKGGDAAQVHHVAPPARQVQRASKSANPPKENGRVLHLGAKKSKHAPQPSQVRMASGSDVIPSEDDPRFTEV